MAQVSITLHALQKIVFVVNYIEIDSHHSHKYFTCWGHSLNWQNLCSLWHLNLLQNSRVYLTLFVWHLSLLTLKRSYLILVVAFEFANKSSIYFIQCHYCVVNSMRIKWGLNFHSTTNFLDTWDEIITSFMGAMNTYVVCMHHKILFGNLVFTYAYSQQVLNDVLFFFHFSNVEECLNSRRLVKKLCQNQRYVKMCWSSLLKNVSTKLGEFFSLKAREFFQNILFNIFLMSNFC